MAWMVIREATDEDRCKLEDRAEKFAQRHGIQKLWFGGWALAVDEDMSSHYGECMSARRYRTHRRRL